MCMAGWDRLCSSHAPAARAREDLPCQPSVGWNNDLTSLAAHGITWQPQPQPSNCELCTDLLVVKSIYSASIAESV